MRMSAATRPVHSQPSQESPTPQRMIRSSLKTDASTPRRISSDLDLAKLPAQAELPMVSKPTSVRTPRRPAPTAQSGPSSVKPEPNTPGLGPVFSPVRQVPQPSGSPSPRRVSYVCAIFRGPVYLNFVYRNTSVAWTLPPVQPVVQSSAASSSLSFAEIQQSQILQSKPTSKDKRSLIEIQEEEQAIRAEEDFMKWWAAEEARTREEARLAAEALVSSPSNRNQRGKKPRPGARPTLAGGSSKGRSFAICGICYWRRRNPARRRAFEINPNIVPNKSRRKPSANHRTRLIRILEHTLCLWTPRQ